MKRTFPFSTIQRVLGFQTRNDFRSFLLNPHTVLSHEVVTELVGLLDMDKRFRADGSEARNLSLKHFARCFNLER